MQIKSHRFFGILALGILSVVDFPVRGADGPYHFLKEIPVGGEGGWDYSSVDEAGRRLYVSHGTRIVVIDLDKEAVVGEIADTPGFHGLAPAPDLKRGVTSNGRENKASIVDLKTLATLSKVDTGQNRLEEARDAGIGTVQSVDSADGVDTVDGVNGVNALK